jgi:hypothetical protein
LPYANLGTGGALNLSLYSNASVVQRNGIYGQCAGLQTLSSDNKGFLVTVPTSVGESNSISVFAWIKAVKVTTSPGYAIIVGKNYFANDSGTSPYYTWDIRFGALGASAGGNYWLAEVTTGAVLRQIYIPSFIDVIPINLWCHVGFTYNSATGVLTIYKDGLSVSQSTFTALPIDYGTHGRYMVGADYMFTPRDWEGLIEDIRIDSNVYSTVAVAALYAAGQRTE